MTAVSNPLRHALLGLNSLQDLTLHNPHPVVFQGILKSICPCVSTASNIYDVLHLSSNRIQEYGIVVFCSCKEVVVEGLSPQDSHAPLTKPSATPSSEKWKELPD